MSTRVEMTFIPPCDFCRVEQAYVDGRTKAGPWAYMCLSDWRRHGVGVLGTGNGQRLILKGSA